MEVRTMVPFLIVVSRIERDGMDTSYIDWYPMATPIIGREAVGPFRANLRINGNAGDAW